MIVASLLERLFRKIFISGIIVDNGNRAGAPNILIVGGNIVLRVGDVDFYLALVVLKDLLFVCDKLTAFFGIAGDISDGHRQFNSQMEFDGSRKDGIVAEDFLFFIWILRVSADTDSGIGIFGKFGARDSKRAIIGVNSRDIGADGLES